MSQVLPHGRRALPPMCLSSLGHRAVCRSLLERRAEVLGVRDDGRMVVLMRDARAEDDTIALCQEVDEGFARAEVARWGRFGAQKGPG
jgi:hypothetical protein